MSTKWIIDTGHGGMLWGCYLTKGKRSPGKLTVDDPGVFEGEFNRNMATSIMLGMSDARIIPGRCDASIRTRIKAINQVCAQYDDVALVSIHANASRSILGRPKWTDAEGFRVFHARKASGRSRHLASMVDKELSFVNMTDDTHLYHRSIAARNYAILRKTKCPAILVECFFMTSPVEARYMSKAGNRVAMSTGITKGMTRYERSL